MPPGGPSPSRDEGGGKVWWATGVETPVFFDERGHRAKLVRFGGACSAVLVAAWLALVVSGPLGFGHLPAAQFLLSHVHRHHLAALTHRHELREVRRS
jgi:hypothetical protein